MFPPGTVNAYQKLVFWAGIVGEVVRRTDRAGRPFDRFVREELLDPLGVRDLYLGVPDEELSRCAPVLVEPMPRPNPDPQIESTLPVAIYPGPVFNRRDLRQSVGPGGGGIMTARATDRFFAMLACRGELDGTRILSERCLLWCTEPRYDPGQPDPILAADAWVGQGGYWLGGSAPEGLSRRRQWPRILHHPGAGGSIAWADLDTGVGGSPAQPHAGRGGELARCRGQPVPTPGRRGQGRGHGKGVRSSGMVPVPTESAASGRAPARRAGSGAPRRTTAGAAGESSERSPMRTQRSS